MTQLVGVQPQAQPGVASGLQHGAGLLDVEGPPLAEGIDPAGMGRAGSKHLATDQVDVVVGAAIELRRNDMSAEEGGLVGQPASDLQRACLVDGVEPVARFDLEGRGARSSRLGEQCRRPVKQIQVGCSASCGHRRADAAGLVRASRHPRRELVGPITAEHEVAVAVDETR